MNCKDLHLISFNLLKFKHFVKYFVYNPVFSHEIRGCKEIANCI